MYSIFVKKNKKDTFPYGVNTVIQKYITKYGQRDTLVVWPGYQSKTKPLIDDFCAELRRIAPDNTIFFANGMNGLCLVTGTGSTVHDCHVPTIERDIFGLIDHSKCIIFADFGYEKPRINAILIGSSNLSYNTYVKSPAPKGEFDVLLIDEQVIGGISNFIEFKNTLIANTENKKRYLFSKTIDEDINDQSIFKDFISDLKPNPLSDSFINK